MVSPKQGSRERPGRQRPCSAPKERPILNRRVRSCSAPFPGACSRSAPHAAGANLEPFSGILAIFWAQCHSIGVQAAPRPRSPDENQGSPWFGGRRGQFTTRHGCTSGLQWTVHDTIVSYREMRRFLRHWQHVQSLETPSRFAGRALTNRKKCFALPITSHIRTRPAAVSLWSILVSHGQRCNF